MCDCAKSVPNYPQIAIPSSSTLVAQQLLVIWRTEYIKWKQMICAICVRICESAAIPTRCCIIFFWHTSASDVPATCTSWQMRTCTLCTESFRNLFIKKARGEDFSNLGLTKIFQYVNQFRQISYFSQYIYSIFITTVLVYRKSRSIFRIFSKIHQHMIYHK